MIEQEVAEAPTPAFEDCQAAAFSMSSPDTEENIITYFTFDQRKKICCPYGTGERLCNFRIAAESLDWEDIEACTAEQA